MSNPAFLLMSSDDYLPDGAQLPEKACREPISVQRAYLWSENKPPNDLAAQRWGILAPEGPRGDRLLALVEPLRRLREQQQGASAQVFRVPPALDEVQAQTWKKTVFRPQDSLDDELPRYQLLLGDLGEMPLSVQQALSSDGFTGRLAFSQEEDYAAYTEKVLRWDRQAQRPRSRDLLIAGSRSDPATELGLSALLRPGLELLAQARTQGRFAGGLSALGLEEPIGPEDLLSASKTQEASVLMTLSHGEGPPRAGWRDIGAQRERQGALRFGSLGTLRAEDLRSAPFLAGGAWLCFACYGAGTPERSRFTRWVQELRRQGVDGPSPAWLESALAPPGSGGFIAALPMAALANPQGPQVFIGHIDLAWSHSFLDAQALGQRRPAQFMALLRAFAQGNRAGVAFRELSRFLEQANSELSTLIGAEQRPDHDPQLANLWMLRQDLAGYTLLGDPAACLPVAQENAQAPTVSLPSEASTDVQEWEEAMAALIQGSASPMTLAAQLNVSPETLQDALARWREAGRRAIGLGQDPLG